MQDVKFYYMYDDEGVIQSSMSGHIDKPPRAPSGFSIISSDKKLDTLNLRVDVVNKKFIEVEIQKTAEELNEEANTLRKIAYKKESDPLYMEWQYDKTDEAEQIWRDKVAEIKLRYPFV